MRYRPHDLSAKGFAIYVALVLVGLIAFPCYQFFKTGGYLFWSNGMDEAVHLSFSYATYVIDNSGRERYSSYLVTFLHELGLSGGYINVVFDITCSLLTLIFIKRIFLTFGYSKPQARSGALLCFLLPLLFTRFNPIVSLFTTLHFDPEIMRWIVMPWNPETPFIRTPEPQVSWVILSGITSVCAGTRALPWALLAVSPLVYPFVRLPVIFVALALLGNTRNLAPRELALRLVGSFLAISLAMVVFLSLGTDVSLTRFFVFSHLPLIPFSGVVGLILYLIIHEHVPATTRAVLAALVTSTWAVANTQLISGYLVTPVNFENYWGVAVLGLVMAVGILHRSDDHRGWVGLAMFLCAAFCTGAFAFNDAVFKRLDRPREALPLLAEASPRVACNDLYLTTYLDLVHPRQQPTAFSWSRTLNLSSEENYTTYLCDKRRLLSEFPSIGPLFAPLFERLDEGFLSRGGDMFMSLGRQEVKLLPAQELSEQTLCDEKEFIVVTAR
jgi:hypothetical protein